ncbi:cytochrome c oxidase subunit 2A [Desertibacillus haloalkaliphilus]|uniref:cytochrome c oxidase subunit 2A n=1 Tax=Desertibacillus haloalkaliphilus TaxID=1328930 RepID=UPI001C274397|nr:cytochrome c oxidase subunit 2A [Desertibacillus haloalkaliphilus]MBU8908784.1 cytochrome c oxidase subunit 2A [Desertibacillus haloalkaliphilus]
MPRTPLESEERSYTVVDVDEEPLKGTLLSVLVVGLIIIGFWSSVFYLFISRL